MTAMHAVGQLTSGASGLVLTLATAGGSGDAADAKGAGLDRTLYGNPQSCAVDVIGHSAITSGKNVVVTVRLQHSDDDVDGDYADFLNSGGGYDAGSTVLPNAGEQTVTITNTPTGDNHIRGMWNLTRAKRWIRVVVNPDLSASTTDTFRFGAVVTFGGADELPAPQPANA